MKSSNADRKKAETIEEKLYKKLLAHRSETLEVKKDDYFKTTSLKGINSTRRVIFLSEC